jgi:hypothetical protein
LRVKWQGRLEGLFTIPSKCILARRWGAHTQTYIIYIYTYTDYIAFALVYTDPGVRLKIGYPRPQWIIIIFPTKIAAFGWDGGKDDDGFPHFYYPPSMEQSILIIIINPPFLDGFPIDKSLTRGKGTRFTCLMQ